MAAPPSSTDVSPDYENRPYRPDPSLTELAKNVGAGAVETAGDIVQNLPVTLATLGRAVPQHAGAPPSQAAIADPQADLERRRGDMRTAVQASLDESGMMAEFGKRIREYAPDTDPEVQDRFVTKVSRALGSTLPFFASAIGGPVGVGMAGASAGAGETIAEARNAGVTDAAEIEQATGLGVIGGSSEIIPVQQAIRRLTPFLGPLAKEIGSGIAEEFGQEALQQFVQNVAAQTSFDPERGLGENVLESGGTGGVVGGIMNTLLASIGAGRARFRTGGQTDESAGSAGDQSSVPPESTEEGSRAAADETGAQPPIQLPEVAEEAQPVSPRPEDLIDETRPDVPEAAPLPRSQVAPQGKQASTPAAPAPAPSQAVPAGEQPAAAPREAVPELRDSDTVSKSRASSDEMAEIRRIADESTDPDEIVQAYRFARETGRVASPEEEAIADFLSANPIAISSYEDFGDPNARTKDLTRSYLKRKGDSIDRAAQVISGRVGLDVTPQQVVEFIDAHPKGLAQFRQSFEDPTTKRLAERYREITGQPVPEQPIASQEELSTAAEEMAPFAPVRELGQAETELGKRPTGKRADRIKPDPIKGKQPKPLKQIRLDLEKSTGVKVRTAKTKRGTAGTYYPGNARTIIKYQGDLDTTAHEVAHALDDQFGIVAEWAGTTTRPADPSPFDSELIPRFAYTGSGGPKKSLTYNRAEGVAEWVRAWIVNPTEADAAAPKFAKFFKEQVPKSVQRALERFSLDVRTFAGASATERTTANVESLMTSESIKERWGEVTGKSDRGDRGWVTAIASETIDRLRPVMVGYEYAKRIQGAEHVLPQNDLKILARTFSGVTSKVDDIFDNGMVTTKGKRVEGVGGIDTLFEPLDTSTQESLQKDIDGTISLLVNERVIERSDNLDKAAAKIEAIGEQLAALPEQISTQRAKLKKVQAELAELRRRNVRDGSIGKTKTRVKFEREQLVALIGTQQDLKAELAKQKKSIGYRGTPRNVRTFTQRRKERMAGTGGGLYSDEKQAREAIEEAQQDPERFARLREAADRYRKWANSVLRYYRDKGRISSEQYTEITKNNKQYVSMQRLFEDADPKAKRAAGRQLGRVADPIKRFQGSTREIQNPYLSLMLQTATMVREADRNEVMRSFRDMLTSDRAMYEGDVLKLERVGRQVTSKDTDTIKIFVDGEAEYWQFEEDIHQALKGIGDSLPTWYRRAMFLPQIARTFITMSPPFLIRNIIRDAPQRAIVSRTGSKPWGHLYFAHPGGAKKFNDTMAELHKFGGGQFGWYGAGKQDYNKRLQQHVRALAEDRSTILTFPKQIFEGYKKLAKLTEDSGRAAEFRKAMKVAKKDLGYDDYNAGLYAAYQARDILDYAVAGRAVRILNVAFPFTNAAIQGLARTTRGVAESYRAEGLMGPAKFAGRFLMYVGAMEMTNYLWNFLNDDDEELRQQPAYLRDMFWNFKLAPDLWLRIPKPWEFGVLASGISRGIDAARGIDNAFEGWTESMLNALTPFDESALFGPFRAIGEAAVNRDLFRDRNIVPPWEEDLRLDLRKGTENASRMGQLLQEVIGVDARYIDHVIEGQFGGIGRMATQASDLGREGEAAGDRLIMGTSGVLVRSPVYAARDVQWVMDWAKTEGKRSDQRVKNLQDLLSSYYESTDSKRRDILGKRIRDYASSVREELDE